MRRSLLGSKAADTHLEFDASEAPIVPLERPQPLAAHDVPQDHLPVAARADDAVPLQPDGVHGALVPAKRTVQRKRLPVPHTDQGVFRAGFRTA